MLRVLRVKQLALVEDLTWELGPGLTVLSGETGAGKSVVIGALTLLLGDRADKSLIRAGSDQCVVEGEWDLGGRPLLGEVEAHLESHGVEGCEEGVLRLRRVVSTSGQNRQFINGSSVPLATLRQLGAWLADFHGPHDHQSLLSVDTQRDLLDRYGSDPERVSAVRSGWGTWREAERARDAMAAEAQATEAELELLRFQVEEIEAAGLEPGEDERLASEYDRVRHGARLMELAGLLRRELEEGEVNVTDSLAAVDRLLSEVVALDGGAAGLRELLAGAQAAVGELARDVGRYADKIDVDPERAAEVEARFNLVQTLRRKYGPGLDAVIAHAVRGRERLDRLERRDAELAEAEAAAQEARHRYETVAERLSQARRAGAERLGRAITEQLRDLGFKKATFRVTVERGVASGAGWDAIEFLFSPNPGEGERPLRDIASSGEMARVMLAIKTSLAEQDQVPLLVFDEVDANVGGEIASRVARKLRGLGKGHQVVCITHLPQVAAYGEEHWEVEKVTEGARTYTRLRALDAKTRVDELARMLGGDAPTFRELARALLVEAQRV